MATEFLAEHLSAREELRQATLVCAEFMKNDPPAQRPDAPLVGVDSWPGLDARPR